ncbi:hypothetical protein BDA99DRAFT_531268 [Phascolomyces articulosus]|uniref:Uncharacterized protein n=1 Tax=Phascolomyces articulosus TaxID=60185 RepID=A0AAD5PKT7_9FUNG|nr:hypothetical protein BDA99DRAFT_531268 [Phascolomyces articulosus]
MSRSQYDVVFLYVKLALSIGKKKIKSLIPIEDIWIILPEDTLHIQTSIFESARMSCHADLKNKCHKKKAVEEYIFDVYNFLLFLIYINFVFYVYTSKKKLLNWTKHIYLYLLNKVDYRNLDSVKYVVQKKVKEGADKLEKDLHLCDVISQFKRKMILSMTLVYHDLSSDKE